MKPSLGSFRSFLLAATFLLSWAKPNCGEAATPVASSSHRLAVTADRGYHATLGLGGDAPGAEEGDYYGATVNYLYRTLPWLELGGRASYGGANYMVNDVFYVGGVARGALRLGSEKRWELGLSLTAGTLMLDIPNIPDGNNVTKSRNHPFLGVSGAAEPDVRWWVTPTLALSFAGRAEIGKAFDVVPVERDDLGSTAYLVSGGGSLGVVVAL
jgi:hypothetical protein